MLKQIENCTAYVKAPSTFNPAVPKELDYIVLRALAKQRDKRFQNGEDFSRVLKKFLATQYPDFGTADLAQAIKHRFKNEIAEDRKLIQQLSFKAEELLEKNPDGGIASTAPSSTTSQTAASPVEGRRPPIREAMLEVKEDTTWVRSFSGEVVASGAAMPSLPKSDRFRPAQASPYQNPQSTRSISRPSASNAASESVSSPGNSFRFVFAFGALALVAVSGAAWFGVSVPVVSGLVASLKGNAAPSGPVSVPAIAKSSITQSLAASLGDVEFELSWMPSVTGVEIWVNGKLVGTDLKSYKAPAERPIQMTFRRTGFKEVVSEFIPKAGQPQSVRLDPEQAGFLSVVSTPSAEVYLTPIEGSMGRQLASSKIGVWSLGSAVDSVALPVGRYRMQLLNEVLGLGKSIEFAIEEGKATRINETLTPAASND